MRTTLKIPTPFFVLLLLIILLVSCGTNKWQGGTRTAVGTNGSHGVTDASARRASSKAERAREINRTMRQMMRRKIDVKGVVVDENGNAIKGVRIRERIFDRGETARTRVSSDGRFKASYGSCLGLYLSFSKPGYYQKELRFVGGSDPSGFNEVLGTDGYATIQEKDLKVTLEEVGPATYLIEEKLKVTQNLDGKWECATLVRDSRYEVYLKDNRIDPKSSEALHPGPLSLYLKPKKLGPFNLNDPNIELPDSMFYVKAPLGDDGKFVVIDHDRLNRYVGGSTKLLKNTYPPKFIVGITGKGNGFVRYISKANTAGVLMPGGAYREIKEAPVNGYSNEIELQRRTDNRQFFYFKAGSLYGKGCAFCACNPKDPTIAHCTFVFRIQADGSRNLREMEGISIGTPTIYSRKEVAVPKVPPIDFKIKGVVVDPSGETVKNVRLRKTYDEHSSRSVSYDDLNEGFEINQKANYLYLDFAKAGYYPRSMKVREWLKDYLKDGDGIRQLHASDLKVVLDPIGTLEPMGSWMLPLEFRSIGGESRAYRLALSAEKKSLIDTRIEYENPGGVKELPSGAFTLRAEVVDGKIVLLDKDVPRKGTPLRAGVAPQKILLGLKGDMNGLIYLPSADAKGTRALRALKDAPKTGYENEVALDPTAESHVFYVKLGKFYGKGYCEPISRTTEDGRKISSFVRIYLNLTGTTNVRTPF